MASAAKVFTALLRGQTVQAAFLVACVLPTVILVKRRLRAGWAPVAILRELDRRGPGWPGRTFPPDQWAQAVNRALSRLGVSERACVPRSLALYGLLCRGPQAVQYLSGVRHWQGELDGHAWIELSGAALPADAQARQLFTVNFTHGNRATPDAGPA